MLYIMRIVFLSVKELSEKYDWVYIGKDKNLSLLFSKCDQNFKKNQKRVM